MKNVPICVNVPPLVNAKRPPRPINTAPRLDVASRWKPRGALFGGAETTKTLTAEIRMSLIARARLVTDNLSQLTQEESDAIIGAERARHSTHVQVEWYSVYSAFLQDRILHSAVQNSNATASRGKRKAVDESLSHKTQTPRLSTPTHLPSVKEGCQIEERAISIQELDETRFNFSESDILSFNEDINASFTTRISSTR